MAQYINHSLRQLLQRWMRHVFRWDAALKHAKMPDCHAQLSNEDVMVILFLLANVTLAYSCELLT